MVGPLAMSISACAFALPKTFHIACFQPATAVLLSMRTCEGWIIEMEHSQRNHTEAHLPKLLPRIVASTLLRDFSALFSVSCCVVLFIEWFSIPFLPPSPTLQTPPFGSDVPSAAPTPSIEIPPTLISKNPNLLPASNALKPSAPFTAPLSTLPAQTRQLMGRNASAPSTSARQMTKTENRTSSEISSGRVGVDGEIRWELKAWPGDVVAFGADSKAREECSWAE